MKDWAYYEGIPKQGEKDITELLRKNRELQIQIQVLQNSFQANSQNCKLIEAQVTQKRSSLKND